MKKVNPLYVILLSILSLSLIAAALPDTGESVNRRGTVTDDYYAAGGTVMIDANVKGDVIAAGGTVTVGKSVSQDVMAAGGTVTILGKVQDDVRVAGGDVTVNARIGDDLLAAGGNIVISPGARITGDARIGGGNIEIDGTINGDLSVGGGKVEITGTVRGDVNIEADDIEIDDGARILGNLTYKSPKKAEISSNAVIRGKVTYTKGEQYQSHKGFSFIPVITLSIAGVVLLLLFPNFTQAASARVSTEFWKNLGLGFALMVATPVAAILIMITVVGFHVGMPLLLIYGITILTSFLIGVFFVANYGANLMSFDTSTRGRLVASLIAAMIVLYILRLIPVLGGLAILLLLLTAMGATTLQVYEVYRGGKNLVPVRKKKASKKKKISR